MGKKLNELNDVSNEILNVLKSNIETNTKSENFPNTSKIYSIGNIVILLEDKYPSLKIHQSFDDIKNCEEIKLKYILIKNYYYNEKFPYYYLSNIVSDNEAITLKNKLEIWSEKQAKPFNERKLEMKRKLSKNIKKRKVSQKQINALKKAREAKKTKKNEN